MEKENTKLVSKYQADSESSAIISNLNNQIFELGQQLRIHEMKSIENHKLQNELSSTKEQLTKVAVSESNERVLECDLELVK